jgi:hypothetical protein
MRKTAYFTHLLVALLLLSITKANAALKGIDEFTSEMNRYPGYFTFYYDDDSGKLYLEVARLNQAFLLQQSMPYGLVSNDIGLDRGQLGETRLVQFERHGNKVLLRQLNTYYRANSENAAEQQSIREAFASSVLQGFEVKAKDADSVLIDYTPYLISDVHGIGRTLAQQKQGNFSADASRSSVYMPRSKSFAKNTEMEAIVSFKGSSPGEYIKQVAPDPYAISVHLHHSLIELPDDNYTPREFHPQSGYWAIEHKDYAAPLTESMLVRYIPRHRLAKKDPTAAVSEAVEPIVYYLDPGVPEPVKTALLEGAKWWQQAFEAAGYKDAYQVKILPAHADPMDIRYNVIQWVHRATRGWSYGSSVIDPRTGEIIKGHVTLGSLRVRQDILIAEALAAPYKNGNEAIDELQAIALDRIRQLSAHEVGHTLGIAHNFSASVKDRASVMDYPHPLVSLNDAGQLDTSKGYASGMGEWDVQVVKYGYSDFTAVNESEQLAAIIAENKAKGLEFISDSDARAKGGAHPTGHLWDNGNDPAAELTRVLALRNKAIAQFGLANIKTGTALSQLEEVFVPLYLFHRYQVEAAVKLIGGVDYHYEVRTEQQVDGVKLVENAKQQAALTSLLATLDSKALVVPEHVLALIAPKAYGDYKTRESVVGRTGLVFDPMALPEVSATHSLSLLLNSERLNRLHQQSLRNANLLSARDVLIQLAQQVYSDAPKAGLERQIHQRIQLITSKMLFEQLHSAQVEPEVQAEIYSQLQYQLKHFKRSSDVFERFLANSLSQAFANGQWPANFKQLKMPPGSPI